MRRVAGLAPSGLRGVSLLACPLVQVLPSQLCSSSCAAGRQGSQLLDALAGKAQGMLGSPPCCDRAEPWAAQKAAWSSEGLAVCYPAQAAPLATPNDPTDLLSPNFVKVVSENQATFLGFELFGG